MFQALAQPLQGSAASVEQTRLLRMAALCWSGMERERKGVGGADVFTVEETETQSEITL